jgi:enoyl-CoA hydratase/carnithine racemase
MSADKMLARKDGPIGYIVFNNPKRHNAVSLEMWEAVSAILDDFEADEAIRVVVVTGEGGKAFVTGADMSRFESEPANTEAILIYNQVTAHLYKRLHEFGKPTIAMIRGYCLGGGLTLAVCCDLRICTEGSRFGLPAARLSLGYPFAALKRLADVVGLINAKQITLTADKLTADRALSINLVNEVIDDDVLEAHVKSLATRIAKNAPLTVSALKYIYLQITRDPAERNLEACRAMVDACFDSDDYVEGRRAFMEKRDPEFKGT